MARKVGRGGSITLDAEFKDGTGSLVDPLTPRVDIVDSDDVEVVTDAVPTRIAEGRYEYTYDVAVDAPLGSWLAHWTGTINSAAVSGDEAFEVVEAGSVGAPGDAWIDHVPVGVLVQTDLSGDDYIEGLIAQAQGLAEVEVGTQATPSAGLKAVLAQIVARMWQAGKSAQVNPAAMQSETVGPFNYQNPNAGTAGLGLTNREKAALRKAAGVTGLWIQPTTRGEVETAPIHENRQGVTAAQQLQVAGGADITWFDPEDIP
jgi:hypothetical protein